MERTGLSQELIKIQISNQSDAWIQHGPRVDSPSHITRSVQSNIQN